MTNRSMFPAALLALAALLAPNRAECGTLVDIGSIGGPITNGFAINNARQVTGQATVADGGLHAFLYSGGSIMDLGLLPGGSFSSGRAINNAGQIVGYADTLPGPNSYAITGNAAGIQIVPVLPVGSVANGINDSGTIVATALANNSQQFVAVQVLNGVPIYFGLSLGTDTTANAISNTGLIVGEILGVGISTSYLYTPDGLGGGSAVTLGSFGGSTLTFDVNDSGSVVGVGFLSANINPHAFLYTNGVLMDLNRPGWDGSYAYGINNKGQVVGNYFLGNTIVPFLYDHGVYTDLNSLIDPSLNIVLNGVRAINDNGQLLVSATQPGFSTTYILSLTPAVVPTPEPSTIVLAGLALAGGVLFANRCRTKS